MLVRHCCAIGAIALSAALSSFGQTSTECQPVGGQLANGRKILKRVNPEYPAQMKGARIGGCVVLDASIGRDGAVTAVHVVSGHPLLATWAVNAVKQWQYEPYILCGEPVEAHQEVEVFFSPDAPTAHNQSECVTPTTRAYFSPSASMARAVIAKAERGEAEAEFALAQAYVGLPPIYKGVAVPFSGIIERDEKKAASWYSKAAEQGFAVAQNNLGVMYEEGRACVWPCEGDRDERDRDRVEAVRLYRKAAEQGYAGAQYHLGKMYEDGRGGLERDSKAAAEWYRKAAEQGYEQAITAKARIEEANTQSTTAGAIVRLLRTQPPEGRHYSYEVFQLPAVKADIKRVMGDYDYFEKRTLTNSPVVTDGDVLLASGCRPHSCGTDGGSLSINLKTGQVAVAMYEEGRLNVYLGDYTVAKDVPELLKTWLSDHKHYGVHGPRTLSYLARAEKPKQGTANVLFCESSTRWNDGREMYMNAVFNGRTVGIVLFAGKPGFVLEEKLWDNELVLVPKSPSSDEGIWISHFLPPHQDKVSAVAAFSDGRKHWSLKINFDSGSGKLLEKYLGGTCSTKPNMGAVPK